MKPQRTADKRPLILAAIASLTMLALIAIIYKLVFAASTPPPRSAPPVAPVVEAVPANERETPSPERPGPPVQVFRGEPFEVPGDLMNPEPPGDPAFTPVPPPPGLEFDPSPPIEAPPEPPVP